MAIEPAFAVPKGHSAGLRYLQTFVEELKASRRVADALQCTSTADPIDTSVAWAGGSDRKRAKRAGPG